MGKNNNMTLGNLKARSLKTTRKDSLEETASSINKNKISTAPTIVKPAIESINGPKNWRSRYLSKTENLIIRLLFVVEVFCVLQL